MKKIYISILLVLATMWGCGKVSVNVDQDTYNPKIVVEGYLYPGQQSAHVQLTRNYGLNMEIDLSKIVISDATVTLSDMANGTTYGLQYNAASLSYEYPGSDLLVEYNHTYRLDVQASIDGTALSASAVTTTPENGFSIDKNASKLGTLNYTDALESDTKFNLKFHRSPTIDSYITSIVALDASLNNFIEDNIFGIDKEDIDDPGDADELKWYNFLKNQSQWTMTELGQSDDLSSIDIEWFSTWFYGRYRVIMYCADVNMTEYFLTHNQIMEEDGNLLEPKFHFEGDAIGVFGSAIADTVYFNVTK